MLSDDEFTAQLVADFNLPASTGSKTGFFDELAFDSFDAVRLLVWLDSIADVDVPELDFPILLNVADAYEYYLRQTNRS